MGYGIMEYYDLDRVKLVAEQNVWGNIMPEIGMVLLAMFVLFYDLCKPHGRQQYPIGNIVIVGQLLLFIGIVYTVVDQMIDHDSFSGMLYFSMRGEIMRLFFMITSILVCHLGNIYLETRRENRVEFFHIVLVVSAGLMLLAQSHNFIMLFVCLELVTIGFYVLVSYARGNLFSLEAGLKYLIMGALSSSILLFGIVLLYGMAGNPNLPESTGDPLNFSELTQFIAANRDNFVVIMGALLVIAGIAFKIGVVPFQIWIPDVYQGAPTPVTAFLAIGSKAGGFIVLINLVSGPFSSLGHILIPLFSAMAAITILFANLTATSQRNVKRLMGLSGVSHAGFMLIGVVASFHVAWGVNAVLFYLFTYLFASIGTFYMMTLLASVGKDGKQDLSDYEELAHDDPFLGGVLIICLGSLAGIPPLAGFIGKALVFYAALQAELYALLVVAVIGVVISIYYYFGWIMTMLTKSFRRVIEEKDGAEKKSIWPEITSAHRVVMGCIAIITVCIGFYQAVLGFVL